MTRSSLRLEATLSERGRPTCYRCFRPQGACYCADLAPFETDPEIVLLIHPRETKKAIGTARLTHLSLSNSSWIRGTGEDFDSDVRVHALVNDPGRVSAVLFPSETSLDLDGPAEALAPLQEAKAGLRVFVIDGTWIEARKMILRSRVLSALPRIMFRPAAPSSYRIRKQPRPVCVSTVEAVHALLERAAERGLGRLPVNREHDQMLRLFERMVEFQIHRKERLRR